jgi:hypothetical protein
MYIAVLIARHQGEFMATVSVARFEDALVLHFETRGNSINAYTLASTLVAVADAAKAANSSLNPGYEIEVVVEAVGPGSFRATLRTLYKKKGVLAAHAASSIILGVIGNYIYEQTFAADDSVRIEINTDEVIIERGKDRVVVPRNVYEATRQAEKNEEFPKAITRALGSVANDEGVSGLALVESIDAPPPEVILPRRDILLASLRPMETPENRVVPEIADLQIVKAILEKSKRKWEFMWRGFKISAPILDDRFYVDFFAHDITIAPGDVLNVTLHIFQKKDRATGIYRNIGYEVVSVHGHTPRVRQMSMIDA